MTGYRILTRDMMGYESKARYTTDYDDAVKEFNRLIKLTIENYDVINNKDSFGEIKTTFKKYKMFKDEIVEIVCMKAPYIIYKKGKLLIGSVFYGYTSGYEYPEYDIGEGQIVIEEIEIFE